MIYEKPNFEEMDLILEGSFLDETSGTGNGGLISPGAGGWN